VWRACIAFAARAGAVGVTTNAARGDQADRAEFSGKLATAILVVGQLASWPVGQQPALLVPGSVFLSKVNERVLPGDSGSKLLAKTITPKWARLTEEGYDGRSHSA